MDMCGNDGNVAMAFQCLYQKRDTPRLSPQKSTSDILVMNKVHTFASEDNTYM